MKDWHMPCGVDSAHSASFDYVLSGWNTRSYFPLTGVPTKPYRDDNIDVWIEIAHGSPPMAAHTGHYVFEHSFSQSLVKIGGVCEFEVSEGRRIRVWPVP